MVWNGPACGSADLVSQSGSVIETGGTEHWTCLGKVESSFRKGGVSEYAYGEGRGCASDGVSGCDLPGLRLGPVPGQKVVDTPGGMVGQTPEHIGEPGLRIDAIELGGLDQRVEGSRAMPARIRAGEGSVAAAHRDGTD